MDTAPIAASASAAHCASRSWPINRSGPSASARVSFQTNVPSAVAERMAAMSRTREVSDTKPTLYFPQMRAVDLIRHKRDGGSFNAEEIRTFVKGVTEGAWP